MGKNMTLFKLFFLASAFTFSGGLAMIPMLRKEIVEENSYLTSEEFFHYISLAQSVPGVTVVTTACLLGQKVNGKSGRFFASIGAITPVLIIMTVLTIMYQSIPQEGAVKYILSAVRATAGIFILEAAIDMFPYIIQNRQKTKLFVIFTVMAITVLGVSIIYIILLCLILAIFSIILGKDII